VGANGFVILGIGEPPDEEDRAADRWRPWPPRHDEPRLRGGAGCDGCALQRPHAVPHPQRGRV